MWGKSSNRWCIWYTWLNPWKFRVVKWCNNRNHSPCPVSRTLFLKMVCNLLTFSALGNLIVNLHLRRLWYQRLCSPPAGKSYNELLWSPTISKQFRSALHLSTEARTLELYWRRLTSFSASEIIRKALQEKDNRVSEDVSKMTNLVYC